MFRLFSTASYAQHHPDFGDGIAAFQIWLEAMDQPGMPLEIQKIHRILGQGNFVVAQSKGRFQNQHVAFYDLFRIDRDKSVEHWDVIQPIPDKSTWKHDNGKFGSQSVDGTHFF
jgi:predicted SnoaL-like aldol condensation-catalyzing enzyme